MLTVEIEHVNCEFLSSLEANGVRVQPSPKTISVVQDKYAQKEHFEKVRDFFVFLHVVLCSEDLFSIQKRFAV